MAKAMRMKKNSFSTFLSRLKKKQGNSSFHQRNARVHFRHVSKFSVSDSIKKEYGYTKGNYLTYHMMPIFKSTDVSSMLQGAIWKTEGSKNPTISNHKHLGCCRECVAMER